MNGCGADECELISARRGALPTTWAARSVRTKVFGGLRRENSGRDVMESTDAVCVVKTRLRIGSGHKTEAVTLLPQHGQEERRSI